MAELVLGPLLRHAGEAEAVLWVEADAPCEVAVLGRTARTFEVEGHHYGIVVVAGLGPGSHAYEVALDGKTVWPGCEGGFPPSLIRTLEQDTFRLAFGSCRVTAPAGGRHGADALQALAARMAACPPAQWPHALLMLGDQVYADEVSPRTRAFIEARRPTGHAHGGEAGDFEEYTRLYREAWSEPAVRWLLANVASTMSWDDHDVHDDWNISHAWLERMRTLPRWRERIAGAVMSYWLYQHLGNLSPAELEADELLARVRASGDGAPLRAFARGIAEGGGGAWSCRREFGRTRLIVLDCRAGRVLAPGARSMLSERDWRWLEGEALRDCDHLLVAVSTPWILAPGLHHLESWCEAVCDGAWGGWFAARAERLREALDLDHWPAFRRSFDRLGELLRRAATGAGGTAPASIVVLGGDIHNGWVGEVAFERAEGARSRVYQAVSSPLRNTLSAAERFALRLSGSRAAHLAGHALLASARLPRPSIRWRRVAGPWLDNHVSILELRGRQARLRVERAAAGAVGLESLADLALTQDKGMP